MVMFPGQTFRWWVLRSTCADTSGANTGIIHRCSCWPSTGICLAGKNLTAGEKCVVHLDLLFGEGNGSVARDYGQFKNWLPNGGVGLRFEIVKRMNLRIDYGIGMESNAFYFSFNEAF